MAALAPRIEAAEAELNGLADSDLLQRLGRRLGLDRTDIDLLAAAIAFASDPRIPVHAEALGGPLARRGLSIALFVELAELSAEAGQALVARLAAGHPLVAHSLLSVADVGATPAARPYAIPPRLLAYAAGIDACEPGVDLVVPATEAVYDPAQRAVLDDLSRALETAGQPHVLLEGRVGTGRRSAVARAIDRSVAVLDASRLRGAALEHGVSALHRESLLRDAVPVLADVEPNISREDGQRTPLTLHDSLGRVVVVTSTPALEIATSRPLIRLRWPVPDGEHRKKLWIAYGTRDGERPAGDLDLLALRYRVGPGAIVRAVQSASTLRTGRLDTEALSSGLRHNIGEKMAGIAHRVEVTQNWDDIVLAEDIRDQVNALVARVRHSHQVLDKWGYRQKMARGGGIAALFSGPPGTGKTMVSGLIARELDLELYQVDLSQVVSKWIGETEKQLSRVFDAAEEGHALLLFDEADALFGQRSSEVRGATDRYANMEVNYLLQRVEAFGGITVLTTNLDTSIDRALKRRLAAHIVFAMPDEEERATLWERLLRTASAPIEPNIDYDDLARAFPLMSGANIRNAVFSGAFMAASDAAARIGQAHLMRAARAEYRSMGHVLAEGRTGLF